MKSFARLLQTLLVTLGCWLIASPAMAQAYASKQLRILVAYAPGGATDSLARHLASAITEKTGQQVIVENRPGGASAIAIQAMLAAPADGYTVLLSDPSATTTNPFLFKKLTYKPESLVPVTRITRHYIALFVRGDSPYKTLKDYVEAAKASQGKMMFSHAGAGTNTHLMGLRFNDLAGIKVGDVAYRGDLPALQEVLGGHLSSSWAVLNSAMPFVKAGTIRVLGVMADKRVSALPDVPTFAESGYAPMTTTSWFGIFAAPGVPPATLAQVNTVFRDAAQSPKVVEWMAGNVMDAVVGTPQDLADLVKSDASIYSEVISRTGITLD